MIYFDNAATTKINDEVLNSFNIATKQFFANSSSTHKEGMLASQIEKKAREQAASFFNASEEEIIFTSGASESNNLAIKGVAFRYQNRGKHIVTTAIEHLSVINTCKQLEELYGFEVTYLLPDENGVISCDKVISAIKDNTILVSIMAVNNETGAIQPISEIASSIKKYPKIYFHSDATQAIGKIDIDYRDVDLISLSGHKINSFKSSGILIKRKSVDLIPQINGGGHQYNMRSGTTNVPGEIALAKALRIAFDKQHERYKYVKNLNLYLVNKLNEVPGVILNSNEKCSPYIISFSCSKKGSVVAEALSNREIYVSTKSACSSKKNSDSYVLRAMDKSDWISANSLRISFSYENTLEEIDVFIKELKNIINSIK